MKYVIVHRDEDGDWFAQRIAPAWTDEKMNMSGPASVVWCSERDEHTMMFETREHAENMLAVVRSLETREIYTRIREVTS